MQGRLSCPSSLGVGAIWPGRARQRNLTPPSDRAMWRQGMPIHLLIASASRTARQREAAVLTANMTANFANPGGRPRTSADLGSSISLLGGRLRTMVDARNAVFKTVCGALLRRPGWVRFPSIPAKSGADDSHDDSHSSGHRRALTSSGGQSTGLNEPRGNGWISSIDWQYRA